MKCFWLNHWWKELPAYNIQTSDSNPSYIRNTTYQKRICVRCKKEDFRLVETKIIGIDV